VTILLPLKLTTASVAPCPAGRPCCSAPSAQALSLTTGTPQAAQIAQIAWRSAGWP
jgi:hypothetical protein